MIEDALKSIRATLYDRTASPLFGAFAVSWLGWNYKFVVVLLSSMSVASKFRTIEEGLYGDPIWAVVSLFLGPALTALAFLYLYPWPAKQVFRFWREQQKQLKDIRTEIEDATRLTIEESRKIRRQVIDLQLEYDKQISRNNDEAERLKSVIAQNNEEILRLQKQAEDLAAISTQGSTVPVTDSEVDSALRSSPYRLYFNPERGRQASKIMLFGPDGKIIEGNNNNEHHWRIFQGRLELLQVDNQVHSRFDYNRSTKVFTHTNEKDTKSIRGQFLIPEKAEA